MTGFKIFPNKNVLTFLLSLLIPFSIHFIAEQPALKAGRWKASIQRSDGKQIVFNFETRDSAGKPILYVINGNERLLVDSIVVKGDSIFIQMPFFESSFEAKLIDQHNIKGEWVKNFGSITQRLPFVAEFNRHRFEVDVPAGFNISGRWAADFTDKSNEVSHIVGEFSQQGSYLTGTFLDPTGDYRFLEGVVTGDSLMLSTFDGGHAYLFTAKINNDQTISAGKFYSGARSVQDWKAVRNEQASIPDGYGTATRKAAGKLQFSFPQITDGKPVSLSDKRYKDKVVVIQILGSWCPNCMDETKFLSEYYQAKKQAGLEVIGIAYERTTDFEKSSKALQSFRTRFNVQYPILVSGVAVSDSLRAEKTLPQLGKIEAFPTTIFLDKKGNIAKVHSGFSGPATGKHYDDYKKEFDETVSKLLYEK